MDIVDLEPLGRNREIHCRYLNPNPHALFKLPLRAMDQPCSYAWRGFRGVGKRTRLLRFLSVRAERHGIPFHMKSGVWFLTKPSAGGGDPDNDDDDDDGSGGGKSIPYEESAIHLGFDCARMSMSDKVFLQSILTRWTGQQDVCLMTAAVHTRYLVLYHAHYLTDESVLQLQECLEQYPNFAVLLTTELPICARLRDYCFEIPVGGEDHLLAAYVTAAKFADPSDVWLQAFTEKIEDWSRETNITDLRAWIYLCLQRNLRWTDVIMYWMQAIYQTAWITPAMRVKLLEILWRAESGSGWVLVTSYRIPILWEHVHLQLARGLFHLRAPLLAHENSLRSTTEPDASTEASTEAST